MAEKERNWENHSEEGEGQVLTEKEIRVKKPHLYRVVLLNDDFTPMDFVVWILQKIFHKSLEEATLLMWQVHMEGRGVAGVFTYEVAQTKMMQVKEMARSHEHPLECIMEVEEG